ncbi:predicted protein [Nematostella vectensis]|uniref:G-protein coupled receptors family 1 profile domain-containing protein n=1 Tax=Nematostella vectensis TaxID=45351 RepID=A7SY03_NEMVE|nr:predicted protein [Nematostella vectensis]|eukprot:XP_001623511.1 predicted protein [Nematostella vectensis]
MHHTNESLFLLNSSSEHNHGVSQYAESVLLHTLRLFLVTLIILVSLVGNPLLLRAVWIQKGPKTITYYLVSNLALSEMVSTSCLPFLFAYMELKSWPFGEVACHIIAPLQQLAGLVVTGTLSALAFYRCSVVLWPLKIRRTRFKKLSALAVCCGLWTSSLFAVVPLFMYNKVIDTTNGVSWCLTMFPGDKLQDYPSKPYRVLILFHFMLNFVVSAVIMVVSYSIILLRLGFCPKMHLSTDKHRDVKLTVYTNPSSTETCTEAFDIDTSPNVKPNKIAQPQTKKHDDSYQRDDETESEIAEYEVDLLKMIYAIVIIFLVCYFPYQTFFLLENFAGLSWHNFYYFDILRAYVYVLTCVPNALHPICYGIMNCDDEINAKPIDKPIML